MDWDMGRPTWEVTGPPWCPELSDSEVTLLISHSRHTQTCT